ncbi:DUF1499 domain-containing protein [Motiliproteus sp. SC1-56]|uniref:DUF1499 domain-containing protein n=1 Tax=Motiliproteus sp. SC1-56 TaxID=2799565 RepID=UPI001A8F2E27|nr:DUF1499 domain-containing protein [Motiliproteus sp. SC1-56]
MKLLSILGIAVGGALITVVVLLVVKAHQSKSGEAPGLVAGHLAPCSPKPNCVCSEAGTPPDKLVAPLPLPEGQADADWQRFQQVIRDQGGELKQVQGDYLAATFTSQLFGFVDDFEARRDVANGVIHLRSASRVGTSDLGANRVRVEQLRQGYTH